MNEEYDIINENSPLDQYLKQFELNYEIVNNNETNEKSNNEKTAVENNIGIELEFLKKIYKSRQQSILKEVLDSKLLEDSDINELRCILESYYINHSLKIKSFNFYFLILIIPLVISCVPLYLSLKSIIWCIFCVLTFMIIIILSYKSITDYLLKVCIKLFSRMCSDSRHSVLLVQEMLTINYGFDKPVNLTSVTSSLMNIKKSFNYELLLLYSKRLHFMLSTITCTNECNTKQFNRLVDSMDNIWFKEFKHQNPIELESFNEDNCQVLQQLKYIHNECYHSQVDLLKMILLLWISNTDSVFNINLKFVWIMLKIIFNYHKFQLSISECRQLLLNRMKNKNNKINNDSNMETNKQSPLFNAYKGCFKAFVLHLSELNEFNNRSSINDYQLNLEDCMEIKNKLDNLSKCLRHIKSLKSLCEEMSSILTNHLDSNATKSSKDFNDLKEIIPIVGIDAGNTTEVRDNDDEVMDLSKEIVDEVLEDITSPEYYLGQSDISVNCFVDTFEEKTRQNAHIFLNELQTVISVKADEWKIREAEALKRREAEGKFIFKESLKTNSVILTSKTQDTQTTSPIDKQSLEYGDHSLLSQMILQQKNRILINEQPEENFES